MVNRTAVMAAPSQRSIHGILVSGSARNTSANSTVNTARELSRLIIQTSTKISGNIAAIHLLMAARIVLTISETISRNPITPIRARPFSRTLTSHVMVETAGGSAFQMRLSDVCSSAKTVVAPTRIVEMPKILAATPALASSALAARLWSVVTASRPISRPTSSIRASRATSRPITSPAIAVTRITKGASAKMV